VPGWLEQAKGGLLLLQDIHVLAPKVREELSEIVQVKHYRSLGMQAYEPLECRIVVTATDASVLGETFLRAFGGQLLEIPPLRNRKEDIPPLVWSILGILQAGKESVIGIDKKALSHLEQYAWPANFDELWTVLQRALARAKHDRISPADLPDWLK
jgi:DNA-binding NtrC family response regulator